MFRRWLGFAGFGQVLEYSPAIRVSFLLSYTVGVFLMHQWSLNGNIGFWENDTGKILIFALFNRD